MKKQHSKTYEMTVTAIIAALYFALGAVFSAISFGAIQVRVSCILYQLVAYNKKYFWGLLIGNVLMNLMSPLGFYDMIFGVATGALGTGVAILLNHFVKNIWGKRIITAISVTFFTVFVAWELVIVAHVPFWATWLTVACGQAISQVVGIPLMAMVNKRVKLAYQI